MTELSRPAAPYPADTKAKGWRFELDYEAIQQSDTWALADEVPLAQPALLMMWFTAWAQIPCGSFPSDEGVIRAKCKVPPKDWTRMREVLMRGWWQADDGRLYHPTITQRVLDMLGRKGGERQRKADYRARKEAELKLAEANAQAKESHDVPPMSRGTDAGPTVDSHGSDATGTGTGTGLGIGIPPPSRETAGPDLSLGTHAGRICRAMRQEGIPDGNPSSQALRTLLEAGATEGEFVAAAKKAAGEQKGFGYAIAIVANERKRAAVLAQQVHRGVLPVAETTYQRAMRERMQEAAPDAARAEPNHAAHAADFFNAIEVPTRTVERIR